MRTVLYHGNCPDGLAAATVLLDAFQSEGEEAEFISVNYGQNPPAIVADRTVLIVDFSYPRAVLDQLRASVADLQVLDHHKTAQAELEGQPGCTFDMHRSGATMAWDWAIEQGFALRIPRVFASYVEDRDLWRFRLPFSREVNMLLKTLGHLDPRPEGLLLLAQHFPRTVDYGHVYALKGGAMLDHQEAMVRMMVANAQWMTIQGHRVPVVNASTTFSEVGEALCLKYPEAPFGAYYFDRGDGIRQWGARSRNGFDVSVVAKALGGGGHAAAAGWQQAIGKVTHL